MTRLRTLHARLDALAQRPETWWDMAGVVFMLAVLGFGGWLYLWVVSQP